MKRFKLVPILLALTATLITSYQPVLGREVRLESENINTGSGSVNISETTYTETINVSNNHEAIVETNITSESSTGNNETSNINGDVNLETGDINNSTTVEETINTANNVISSEITNSVEIEAINSNTGANSENTTSVNVEQNITVSDKKSFESSLQVSSSSETGNSVVSNINGDVNVFTGDVGSTISVIIQANNDTIIISPIPEILPPPIDDDFPPDDEITPPINDNIIPPIIPLDDNPAGGPVLEPEVPSEIATNNPLEISKPTFPNTPEVKGDNSKNDNDNSIGSFFGITELPLTAQNNILGALFTGVTLGLSILLKKILNN